MQSKAVYTTKMSSKGQIVIPEGVRDALGLASGVQFVVVGRGDTVVLKIIEEPSMDEFKSLLTEARQSAKRAGVKKAEVQLAIQEARKKQ